MSAHYHDTTHAADWPRLEALARTQDERVAALFREFAPLSLSPSQVWNRIGTKAPLTSIRRAISNLTRDGVLEMTDSKARGLYGRLESKWRLKHAPKQGRLI